MSKKGIEGLSIEDKLKLEEYSWVENVIGYSKKGQELADGI